MTSGQQDRRWPVGESLATAHLAGTVAGRRPREPEGQTEGYGGSKATRALEGQQGGVRTTEAKGSAVCNQVQVTVRAAQVLESGGG